VCTLSRIDLFAADEVFLTGTGAGIVRVRTLDSQPVGGEGLGPITRRIAAGHQEMRQAG
jgi:branched-chain amino acid aminotransferase